MSRKRKQQVTITLDPEVVAYIDRIAYEDERTRSQVLNRMVKSFATDKGVSMTLEPPSFGKPRFQSAGPIPVHQD